MKACNQATKFLFSVFFSPNCHISAIVISSSTAKKVACPHSPDSRVPGFISFLLILEYAACHEDGSRFPKVWEKTMLAARSGRLRPCLCCQQPLTPKHLPPHHQFWRILGHEVANEEIFVISSRKNDIAEISRVDEGDGAIYRGILQSFQYQIKLLIWHFGHHKSTFHPPLAYTLNFRGAHGRKWPWSRASETGSYHKHDSVRHCICQTFLDIVTLLAIKNKALIFTQSSFVLLGRLWTWLEKLQVCGVLGIVNWCL